MGAPLYPQLPAQPNPNPNNKEVQQFETSSMPYYSISPLSCNDLHLQSGRVVEPVVMEDVPFSMNEDGTNQQFGNSFSSEIPIIEDVETSVETPAETTIETPAETVIETHD